MDLMWKSKFVVDQNIQIPYSDQAIESETECSTAVVELS